ncbi:MAG: FAD-dependent oxidoreductase, partial [Planctomycetota bacterium]
MSPARPVRRFRLRRAAFLTLAALAGLFLLDRLLDRLLLGRMASERIHAEAARRGISLSMSDCRVSLIPWPKASLSGVKASSGPGLLFEAKKIRASVGWLALLGGARSASVEIVSPFADLDATPAAPAPDRAPSPPAGGTAHDPATPSSSPAPGTDSAAGTPMRLDVRVSRGSARVRSPEREWRAREASVEGAVEILESGDIRAAWTASADVLPARETVPNTFRSRGWARIPRELLSTPRGAARSKRPGLAALLDPVDSRGLAIQTRLEGSVEVEFQIPRLEALDLPSGLLAGFPSPEGRLEGRIEIARAPEKPFSIPSARLHGERVACRFRLPDFESEVPQSTPAMIDPWAEAGPRIFLPFTFRCPFLAMTGDIDASPKGGVVLQASRGESDLGALEAWLRQNAPAGESPPLPPLGARGNARIDRFRLEWNPAKPAVRLSLAAQADRIALEAGPGELKGWTLSEGKASIEAEFPRPGQKGPRKGAVQWGGLSLGAPTGETWPFPDGLAEAESPDASAPFAIHVDTEPVELRFTALREAGASTQPLRTAFRIEGGRIRLAACREAFARLGRLGTRIERPLAGLRVEGDIRIGTGVIRRSEKRWEMESLALESEHVLILPADAARGAPPILAITVGAIALSGYLPKGDGPAGLSATLSKFALNLPSGPGPGGLRTLDAFPIQAKLTAIRAGGRLRPIALQARPPQEDGKDVEGPIWLSLAFAESPTDPLPFVPTSLRLDLDRLVPVLEALSLPALPARLLVIGGGLVEVQFAALFRSLGSAVILVAPENQLLPEEDQEVGARLREALKD